jgi:hypothetical protein
MLTFNEREIANIIVEALVEYGLKDHLKECVDNSFYEWFADCELRAHGFWAASGATKFCFGHTDLEGWVVKVSHINNKYDYARMEYSNYRLACDAGLAYYFPETFYLGEFDGCRFYLQQEVECDEDQVTSDWYERLRDSYEEDGEEYDVDRLWDEIDNLDDDEKAFLMFHDGELGHFLCENRINDLHEGNFGYINGRCVIIDFSGFRG